ncbi:hypothetical protein ACFFRR_000658 [Megaselia abdita]
MQFRTKCKLLLKLTVLINDTIIANPITKGAIPTSNRGLAIRKFGHHSSYAENEVDPLFSILKLIFFVIATFLIVMAITKCVEHNCCNPESTEDESEEVDEEDDDT